MWLHQKPSLLTDEFHSLNVKDGKTGPVSCISDLCSCKGFHDQEDPVLGLMFCCYQLEFLIFFKQEILHFRVAQGPTNYVANYLGEEY